jgi:type IV pilus assembly protein PilZ
MSDATSKQGPTSLQFQPSQLSGSLPVPAVSGQGGGSTARPSVIQLVFREKSALYAAYIPAFTDGGLFVPTTRDYKLGEDIYLLLALPEDNQRYPVAGKVAWLTPANASGGRTQGVGVRFPGDEKTRQIRARIEEILGTAVSSSKPTQTL